MSTFTFTRSATSAGGNAVITRNATISSGRYAGGVVEEVTYRVLVAGLADCATPQGITSLSGLVVLTIVNV